MESIYNCYKYYYSTDQKLKYGVQAKSKPWYSIKIFVKNILVNSLEKRISSEVTITSNNDALI